MIADPVHAASLNRMRARLDETLATRMKTQAEESLATTATAVEKKKQNL